MHCHPALHDALSRFDPRCRLMLEVTWQTLGTDPDLLLCEGLRLIEATRTAVERLAPASLDTFEHEIMPLLRQQLMLRFGVLECCPPDDVN